MNNSVAVIGGGAAGLMAGAILGSEAFLIESGEHAGRKLLLTGGGKCNFTHDLSPADMLGHYYDRKNFVRPAIYAFPPDSISEWFEREGVASFVAENGKVFPQSGNAADVRNAMLRKCGKIFYGEKVEDITHEDGIFFIHTDKRVHKARYVIVATGGNTFPKTGSDGSIFPILKKLGHTIVPTAPSLSQLFIEGDRLRKAEGITLNLTLKKGKVSMTDSAVITAKGISGPLAENFSHYVTGKEEIRLEIAPITKEEIKALPAKAMLKNVLPAEKRITESLFPDLEGKRIADLNKAELERISRDLTSLPVTVTVPSLSAMSMRGGVSTKEIDSRTMESRIVPGLYLAGECMDVDAHCGGYSLSWAFASAHAAAKNISERLSSC